MNASISGMIDLLFKDTAMNNETRALYEELLNNCQEHYDDLIGRGLSETEALDAVVESLQGMKEVIDEYPKKASPAPSGIPEADPKKPAEPESRQPDPVPGDQVFPAENLRSIVTELRNCDVTLNRSRDGLIHVRSENPDLYHCEFNGTCLHVIQNNHKMNEEFNMQPEDMSIKGILSFVGKVISKTAGSITEQTGIYIDIPETSLDEIRSSSLSGDIDGCHLSAEKVLLSTTSGDISFSFSDTMKAGRFVAKSTSGDISLHGNADETEINSISGDVNLFGNSQTAVLKSTSGDVRMEGCTSRLSTHTISGDQYLSVRNTDIRNIEAASTSGEIEIHLPDGIPGIHPAMRSVSGSLRCRYPDSGSGASLQIRTSTVSGNIEIC